MSRYLLQLGKWRERMAWRLFWHPRRISDCFKLNNLNVCSFVRSADAPCNLSESMQEALSRNRLDCSFPWFLPPDTPEGRQQYISQTLDLGAKSEKDFNEARHRKITTNECKNQVFYLDWSKSHGARLLTQVVPDKWGLTQREVLPISTSNGVEAGDVHLWLWLG